MCIRDSGCLVAAGIGAACAGAGAAIEGYACPECGSQTVGLPLSELLENNNAQTKLMEKFHKQLKENQ